MFESKDIKSTLKIIDFGRSGFLQGKEHFTERAGSVLLRVS